MELGSFLLRNNSKGFKEDRVTTVRLDDLGKSTTLESNKSLFGQFIHGSERACEPMAVGKIETVAPGVKKGLTRF